MTEAIFGGLWHGISIIFVLILIVILVIALTRITEDQCIANTRSAIDNFVKGASNDGTQGRAEIPINKQCIDYVVITNTHKELKREYQSEKCFESDAAIITSYIRTGLNFKTAKELVQGANLVGIIKRAGDNACKSVQNKFDFVCGSVDKANHEAIYCDMRGTIVLSSPDKKGDDNVNYFCISYQNRNGYIGITDISVAFEKGNCL